MIRLEMRSPVRNWCAAARLEPDQCEHIGVPSDVELRFARELATSVWLGQLGDEGARRALSDYVKARHRAQRARAQLGVALETEYRLCRERLDLCS